MKQFFVAILILLSVQSILAQRYQDKKFLIGASAGYQYPLGDFGKQAKGGLGIRASGQMFVNKKIIVGAEVGYNNLGGDDFWDGSHLGNYGVSYNIGSALLKGSFIIESWDRDFKPYVSLAFGYYRYQNKVNFTSTSAGATSQKQTVKQNKVGIVPNIGFMYYLSNHLAFDMNLRYTYIPNFPESVPEINENGDEYAYLLGFTSISLPELSIGFYFRF